QYDFRLGTNQAPQQWSWTAPDDGIYYLVVRNYDVTGTGMYQLQVSEDPDDHGNSATNATEVEVGTTVSGKVQYSDDEDWFSVNVVAGQQYVFNLAGQGTSAGEWHPPNHHRHYFPP